MGWLFVWYKTYGKNDHDILRFPFIAHDGNYVHFGYTQPNIGRRPISVLMWVKVYNFVGEFLDVIKETNGFVAVGYDFLGRGIFVKLNNDADIALMKIYSPYMEFIRMGVGDTCWLVKKTTTVGF
jgi:hypothetical protein